MSTITVPKPDLTVDEVSEALRNGLGSRYSVLPGMQTTRSSFGRPQSTDADTILVGSGSTRVWRAQVEVLRNADQTSIVSPGGLAWVFLVNRCRIAHRVRKVLADAPELRSPT